MATSTQWQLARNAAERYEQILVPAILGPAARALVEWAEPRAGEAVLDVGCGTGSAARYAAARVGPAGRVVGVDINPGMIDVARSLPPISGPAIEWLEENAQHLPFVNDVFDVTLCAQTLQFLTERPPALAEMYRTIKPGGRVAASLWCDIDQSPYFQALVEAVARHVGPDTAAGLGAAFNLTDAGAIDNLFADAGFGHTEMAVAELNLDLPPLAAFIPRHITATPMSAGFHAAPEAARQTVIEEVTAQLAPYRTPEGARVPFRTHLVLAKR